jgi:spermidine/putrescine-binding protein
MCIPKGAKNKLAAERFIDFMLSEEIAVANAEYIYYASPNTLVLNSEEYKEYMGEEGYDLLYNSFGEDFDFASSYDKYCYKSLDDETLAYVTSLWEKLKIESPMDPSIYIVCGVCIAVIATFFTVIGIRKKRREKSYD